MEIYYVLDYLLFTTFASFGVLQIALAKNNLPKVYIGIVITALAYIWFFGSKNRSIPTMVEGLQLLLLFGLGVLIATAVTKFIEKLKKDGASVEH